MMSTLLTSALFISVYSIPNPPRSDNARRTGNGAGKCTLSRGTRDRSFRWMESESGNKERDRLRKRKERTRRSVSVPMGTRTRPPPHVPVRHLRNLSGLGPFRAVFAPAAVPAQRYHRSGATASPFRRNGTPVPAQRHRRSGATRLTYDYHTPSLSSKGERRWTKNALRFPFFVWHTPKQFDRSGSSNFANSSSVAGTERSHPGFRHLADYPAPSLWPFPETATGAPKRIIFGASVLLDIARTGHSQSAKSVT